MTKSTITREQAQKIIVAADEVITALAGTNEDVHPDDSKKMCELWDDLNDRHAPPVVVRELACMALAAMDSEPVGYFGRFDPDDYDIIDQCSKNMQGSFPLYRHAQPAPVVPEEVTAEDCPALVKYDVTEVDEAWARGFNSCRAAMLNQAQAPAKDDADQLLNAVVSAGIGWALSDASCESFMREPFSRIAGLEKQVAFLTGELQAAIATIEKVREIMRTEPGYDVEDHARVLRMMADAFAKLQQ